MIPNSSFMHDLIILLSSAALCSNCGSPATSEVSDDLLLGRNTAPRAEKQRQDRQMSEAKERGREGGHNRGHHRDLKRGQNLPSPPPCIPQGVDVPTRFTLVHHEKHKHRIERGTEKSLFSLLVSQHIFVSPLLLG